MTTHVDYEIAKLLKDVGFDLGCKYFYSKHGDLNYLEPHREYEHLHSYGECLVLYFDGTYNWNTLNVDEGMVGLKTAFSECDGYVNCDCSAPTIAEVVMWLYKKHDVWITVNKDTNYKWANTYFNFHILSDDKGNVFSDIGGTQPNTPTEAYTEAIKYCLINLIK